MDPFETLLDNNDNTNLKSKPTIITIRIEVFGRKKKTCILGWNISDELLKEHLKTIKKHKGCNGTIKEIIDQDNDPLIKIKVLELQGDHSKYIKEFLIEHNVDPNNIDIKG